jgi:hypothetical protein
MADELSRSELVETLARIQAGLADASYRVGRVRQGDRKSRELAAIAINIQGARSDVVALLQLLHAYEGDELPEGNAP